MREIKVRTWHKKKKKWYHFVLGIFRLGYSNEMALCETFGYDGNTNKTNDSSYKNDTPEDYSKLMQFTGRKDKNNKEIYEGDKVANPDYKNKKGVIKQAPRYVIKFEDCGFYANSEETKGHFHLSVMGCEDLEVVGNIWEEKK